MTEKRIRDLKRSTETRIDWDERVRGLGVAILDLDGLPEKGDVSDWLDADGTADQLTDLTERALVAAGTDNQSGVAVRASPSVDAGAG